MLVKYSYLTTDIREHGVYQCEFEDLQVLYQKMPLDVKCLIVEFSEEKNGSKVWLWQRHSAYHRKPRRDYWQPLRFFDTIERASAITF